MSGSRCRTPLALAIGVGLLVTLPGAGRATLGAQPKPPAMPSPGGPPPLTAPLCKGESAILVDAITGTILWEKNSRVRRPVASTTKIMAATVAIESGRLSDLITFSKQATQTPYGNLHAKPGEQLRLYDLLYAILLRSANDGCVAVGEHLFGSGYAYARAMTRRAQELGAADTNFITPNGLHDPRHFSTAFDLALMARHALSIPLFSEIVRTRSFTVERSINQQDCLIKNHNRFVGAYEGGDGVKTGYVKEAGRCLVASSTRIEQGRPWRLISVVLRSPDMYGDSARLMDWGRSNFQPIFAAQSGAPAATVPVEGGTQETATLVAAQDLNFIVSRSAAARLDYHLDRTLRAPIRPYEPVGTLSVRLDGQVLGQVSVVNGHAVTQTWTAAAAPWTGAPLLLAALVWGPKYARTFTKGARRRRRRLPSGRIGTH